MSPSEVESFCNTLHDMPPELKWKIIEGVMRMALTQFRADTHSGRGEAGGKTAWLVLATEDPKLIAAIDPILKAEGN